VVQHDDLVLLVLVAVQLRDEFVGFYTRPREVQGLTDVVLLELLRIAQVQQQEVRIHSHGQLLGLDGDGGEVGSLTAGVFLGPVPVVDGLALLLLVDEFPEGGGLDPAEEFPLLLGGLLVACIASEVLMISTSLTVVPILPASLDSTWSYLFVLCTFTSRIEGLPTW
jgi:hypothetical protein